MDIYYVVDDSGVAHFGPTREAALAKANGALRQQHEDGISDAFDQVEATMERDSMRAEGLGQRTIQFRKR